MHLIWLAFLIHVCLHPGVSDFVTRLNATAIPFLTFLPAHWKAVSLSIHYLAMKCILIVVPPSLSLLWQGLACAVIPCSSSRVSWRPYRQVAGIYTNDFIGTRHPEYEQGSAVCTRSDPHCCMRWDGKEYHLVDLGLSGNMGVPCQA